jgi:hypothetical protein
MCRRERHRGHRKKRGPVASRPTPALGAVAIALWVTSATASPPYHGGKVTFFCDARAPEWCQFQLYHGTQRDNNGTTHFEVHAGKSIIENADVGWQYCVGAGNPPGSPGRNCTVKTITNGVRAN